MLEAFFGFKKTPFGDCPDAKQLFASQGSSGVLCVNGRSLREGMKTPAVLHRL
jgi:hypothetical protein